MHRSRLNEHDLAVAVRSAHTLLTLPPHPNVVALRGLAWSCESALVVSVMELCAGGTLSHALDRTADDGSSRPLLGWLSHKLPIAAGIAQGLAFLHGQSPPIVHRDIKPDNLLLAADLRSVKIADLGLCRPLASDGARSLSVGTPEFTAPEAAFGFSTAGGTRLSGGGSGARSRAGIAARRAGGAESGVGSGADSSGGGSGTGIGIGTSIGIGGGGSGGGGGGEANAEQPYDQSLDVWSFGCVLVCMDGDCPWPFGDAEHHALESGTIWDVGGWLVSSARPSVPATSPFHLLVRGCCQVQPGLRPTAAELSSRLLDPAIRRACEKAQAAAPAALN
jgi:serine/threonine protein kinase